jgi:cytochrome P450
LYEQIRSAPPLLRDPQSGLWMIFDYDGVKRVLNDPGTFSSRHGPAEWLIFVDPPRHTKVRALIALAFTPRSVANLEPRIRELSRQLLDQSIERGEMDLAADYAIPLPLMVIAEMLGIPLADRPRFKRWNDVILNMSYTVIGSEGAAEAAREFAAVTVEMNEYLTGLLKERREAPRDDLLTRLLEAKVDGERLTQQEILGFFQLLLLAGSETTTNLINNAILCFVENPGELSRLKASAELLPSAIEEVLRYRAPFQWMFRLAMCDVELHGQVVPAGNLVLAMMGSANHDPRQFPEPGRFDITRDPNPHLGFGHGIHFCLGASLARLESRIALSDLLERLKGFELASNVPWEPRKGLNVHGPNRLPIRFEPGRRAAAGA